MMAGMTVPDEKILSLLTTLLTMSDPGATLHHLAFGQIERGPLGVGELSVSLAMIDDAGPGDGRITGQEFVTRAIAASAIDTAKKGGPIFLAALALEVNTVDERDLVGADEVTENRLRRMAADGRVQDHELSTETTLLYAAAADGRRWSGCRDLTGPRAGKVEGPSCLPPGQRSREDGWAYGRLLRGIVRLPW